MAYPQRAVMVAVQEPREVRNFISFASASALVAANAVVGTSGLQWIVEDNWVAGQNPALGDLWDASIPATFTAPVVDPVEGPPASLVEVKDQLAALKQEFLDRVERLETGVDLIQGG